MSLSSREPRANRMFTLTVVPDSGYDVKTGNVDLRFFTVLFGILTALFITCLFFIVGFHIKLSQEQDFRHASITMQHYLKKIERAEKLAGALQEKIGHIQRIDRAFRQYAYMDIPDNDMYQAGIGGHQLVDSERFSKLNGALSRKLEKLQLAVVSIDRRVYLEEHSFDDIRNDLESQREEIASTPSILPTQSLNITSAFGNRRNPVTGRNEFHDAVDFTGPSGSKIFATADGVVTKTDTHAVRGHYVVIKHKYGYQTLYAHLQKILVEEGQEVKKHDIIGTMGRTGRTTGVNLHYSISHNGRKVNPVHYF